MKTVFTIFFILFYSSLFSQNNLGIDFSKNENKVYVKLIQDQQSFYGLEDINSEENSNNILRFWNTNNILRFWNTNNCVEIEHNENSRNGKIYFSIKNTDAENEYLRKEISLSQKQVSKILDIYQKLKIENISTDDKINGWTKGFDGRLYEIESLQNNHYSFRSFWTPSIQNVQEAKMILNFWKEMDEIINTSELFKMFLTENKFTCYKYYGTSYSICTILTKKEARKLKRQKRKL